ncbi:hypothetical protein JF544_08090 [Halobacillus kuroshimensis]|uniref:Pectate lyase superfamily protein domain-containing protein n=1 Tax=Halobacillus kuroshimensis TaxID=302481 RepID=A0ABS3DVF1_9BACI|nr:hypothetical protein [Halobacillus kuroshimensis]MBN8235208.1 hypothetical protein [Halobacillus kuroshimensis]
MNKKTVFMVVCLSFITTIAVYSAVMYLFPGSADYEKQGFVHAKDFGAVPGDEKDDGASIQEAVDYSAEHNIGTVKVTGGERYRMESEVVIKQGVEIEFGRNTVVEVVGDFTVFTLEKNASIINGVIEISDASFKSSVITLDGKEQFWSWEITQIHGLTLINTSGENSGTGINVTADQTNEYVSFVDFASLTIVGFNRGIHLKAVPSDEDPNFVNGNRFTNVTLEDCVECIVMEGAVTVPNEVSGNQFTNMQIQPTDKTESIMTVSGTNNYFQGMIWDIQLLFNNQPIELKDQSNGNTIMTNLNASYIRDNGVNNTYE